MIHGEITKNNLINIVRNVERNGTQFSTRIIYDEGGDGKNIILMLFAW